MGSTLKKILIALLVLILLGIVVFFGMRKEEGQDGLACVPVLPIDESRTMIDSLDNQASQFASTTIDLMGQSAEGGSQTTFSSGNSKKIVEQRFYGETGRSYMRFYFEEDKIFSIVKLNLTYEAPISVDSNANVGSTEEKDYFLDASGKVCTVEVNGAAQPVDADTQEMIQEYIVGIK